MLGYKVPSKYYRRGMGVLEILCGESNSQNNQYKINRLYAKHRIAENLQSIKYSHSGLVLLIVPNRKIKKAANIILLLAKLLNLYSHFAIDDQFERMAPTLVFFFMLVCRMVVDWQYDHTSSLPQVDVDEVKQGSYDKVNLRPSLPRQAKNKKEQ